MVTSRKIISLFLVSLVSIALSGCAPGLGKTISVNHIPDPQMVASLPQGVVVKPFIDERSDRAVVIIDGRRVNEDGDATIAARGALERILLEQGAFIARGGTIIQGSIRQWQVTVDPKFPLSKVAAHAEIAISIQDSKGAPRWNGYFHGSVERSSPFFGEESIAEILGEVLSVALHEAVSDRRFIAAMQSSRAR